MYPPAATHVPPAEKLPPGGDLPWAVWKSLNRLRAGVGRCHENRKRWGFSNSESLQSSYCINMSILRKILLVALIHTAIADDADLLNGVKRCKKDDIPCLINNIQNFLRPLLDQSFAPSYHVDHIEHTFDSGEKVAFSNVNVTDLKNTVLKALKFDTLVTKDTALTLDNEPEIVTDIQSDEQSGKISMKGKVRIVADYKYHVEHNAEGVRYFIMGPNTLKCENQGDVEVKAIGGATGEVWEGKSGEMKKNMLCEVCKVVYQDIIDSFREAVKLYPSDNYFQDLED
ncbi:hypothetical protein NE865_12924 [Phthorimaea operculella]|nr:hypothetical protein NE865_12924 [Phthorimaea operculella]